MLSRGPRRASALLRVGICLSSDNVELRAPWPVTWAMHNWRHDQDVSWSETCAAVLSSPARLLRLMTAIAAWPSTAPGLPSELSRTRRSADKQNMAAQIEQTDVFLLSWAE